MMNLSLQEIILIGNASEQVRKEYKLIKVKLKLCILKIKIIIIILCYLLLHYYIGQVQRNDYRHVPNDANIRKRKKSRRN